MITRLSLVTILVRDQEEALRWFTEILGLKSCRMQARGAGRDG
jgi:catechol-2,3-dioxygenase